MHQYGNQTMEKEGSSKKYYYPFSLTLLFYSSSLSKIIFKSKTQPENVKFFCTFSKIVIDFRFDFLKFTKSPIINNMHTLRRKND